MAIERYVHHGRDVAVESDLKGKHRAHCLCYVCDKFNPGGPDHCPIAQRIYDTCVALGVVTPVWECPEFAIAG
jgi:hypothetical protein